MSVYDTILRMSPAWQAFLYLTRERRQNDLALYVRAARTMLQLVAQNESRVAKCVEYVGLTPLNMAAQDAVALFRAKSIPLSRKVTSADAQSFNSKDKRPASAGDSYTDQDWRSAGVLLSQDEWTKDFFGAMVETDNAHADADKVVIAAIEDTQRRRIALGQTNTTTVTNAQGQTQTVQVPVAPIPPGSMQPSGPLVTLPTTAGQALENVVTKVAENAGAIVSASFGGWVTALKWAPLILAAGAAWWALTWLPKAPQKRRA